MHYYTLIQLEHVLRKIQSTVNKTGKHKYIINIITNTLKLLAVCLKQNGEKFPNLGDWSVNRHTSALSECTDCSAVFKFRRLHVPPVSRQTGLKTENTYNQ